MRSHLIVSSHVKSRRQFLGLSLSVAAMTALAACSQAASPATPTQAAGGAITPASPTAAAAAPTQSTGAAATPSQPASAAATPTQAAAGATPAAQAASGSKKPVTLTHTAWSWNPKGYQQFPAEYRKVLDAAGMQYISLEYQQVDDATLQARMAAGNAQDLLYVYPETSQPYAARNQLVSLQDAVNADSTWKTNVNMFFKPMIDAYMYKGKLIAECITAEAECTSFNPKQYQKLGVKTPAEIGEAAWTIDKFIETVSALSDKTGNPPMKGYFADMEFNQGMGDLVSGYGGKWFSDDGRKALFNTKEFVQGAQVLVDLVKSGAALNGIQSAIDGQWVAAALSNKLAATTIAGDWCWGWAHKAQLEKKEFEPGMFYIPSGPAGRKPIAHSAALGLYAQSKNREAAMDFLRLGATLEFQQVAAKLYEVSPQYPARNDASKPIFDKKLLPDFFPKLFDNAVPSPYTPVLDPYPMYGYMYDMLNAVFKGKDTRPLQKVMDDMTTRAQKDLDAAASSLPA